MAGDSDAQEDDSDATAGDPDRPSIEIALIAAVAENRVIGTDGEMPWHYPADLAHFKETTMGHPVIMGRVTYESISVQLGGPLPGRKNIVLTRTGVEAPGEVVQADSIDAATAAAAETGAETAFVAGGASVYEQFLPLADRMVVTEVPGEPDGDTKFPEWEPAEWVETARDAGGDLSFVTYERG